MSIQTIRYSVCDDCILFLANDEINHENKTYDSMHAHIKRECGNLNAHLNDHFNAHFAVGYDTLVFRIVSSDGTSIHGDTVEAPDEQTAKGLIIDEYGADVEILSIEDITEEYEHNEFSYSPCELCNSSLAGSRHAATMVIQEG